MESFAPIAKARGIDLVASTGGSAGDVLADAVRLEQVVGNPVERREVHPAGGMRVSMVKAGPMVEIRVADSGAGITADFLPFVFDRFLASRQHHDQAHGGLGLGLAIAHHLVELHGGTIRAESGGENKGATFVVQMPLLSRNPLVSGQRDDLTLPTERLLSGLRVLIVDDSRDALEMLALLITGAGAQVATAESVEAAERSLDEQRPDLLIADIAMPRADGHVLVRRIRRAGARDRRAAALRDRPERLRARGRSTAIDERGIRSAPHEADRSCSGHRRAPQIRQPSRGARSQRRPRDLNGQWAMGNGRGARGEGAMGDVTRER